MRWSAVAAALAATWLGGCGGPAPPAPSGEPSARTDAQPVAVTTLARVPVAPAIERPGTLRYRRLARIHSQAAGQITNLAFHEGDRVAAGMLLIALDDALARAARDKAQASLQQAELDLTRLSGLQRHHAASQAEIDLARTARDVAAAERRLRQIELDFTRITAPFAGIITARLVEPGDAVAKNTHLLTLAAPQSLIAEVEVSELLLPLLRPGDAAQVRIDALPQERLAANILRIHPQLDERTRHGIVELRLAHLPQAARAGQFVRVRFQTRPSERLLIPLRALRHDRAGEFVWLLADGKARRQTVSSGLSFDARIEIRAGLEAGARLIVDGFLGLAEGKVLKVVEETPQTLPGTPTPEAGDSSR